jgi:hypothetical protein
MSVFSIKFPSFEKASHRTPIRRALSAFAFPNAAIFRRSFFAAEGFFTARAAHGGILSWILCDHIVGKVLDTNQVLSGSWPIFFCRDCSERDFDMDMRRNPMRASPRSARITMQGE